MNYDKDSHVPAASCVMETAGGRVFYTTRPRTGDVRHLVAAPSDDRLVKRWAMLTVWDPKATPRAAYHGSGAYRGVARRADLAVAVAYLGAT